MGALQTVWYLELKKSNFYLASTKLVRVFNVFMVKFQNSLEELEHKNVSLEAQLASSLKENNHTMQKLRGVEQKFEQLQQNMRR